MGIVYKAYDRLMNREVALKTILDIDNPEMLALFYKEWSTLATMVHPNVINIYDIGEFEQDGSVKPFFVMPLLPGVTLDKLIKEASPRLSVSGVLAIIDQAARGLQAAHEQGLIHRDVKPSNIFVMDDGSVKIIDFGIVRSASAHSKTTLKGTLYYMAPEQLDMKPPSPLSDMFALSVVTYEALTRQRPFRGSSDGEIVDSIRTHIPPPISELNHEAGFPISQVVHKAMAKQPWHRFFNVREYGDALMKAMRNEPLEYFDATKIKPRLERASQSYEKGDYEFASEVLSELEAEGHLDQGIALLRGQVDQAVRQIRMKQMLENARRFYEAAEYPLALRKIQEALDLDSNDATALSLKSLVERERREKKISEWVTLAQQHLENQAFRQAREALDNVLQLKPNDTDALGLAAEVGRREKEVAQVREQKGKLYQAAMQAWEKGDVTAALTKLEVLIAMDRDQPEAETGRSGSYQGFYNKVHSEHNLLKNSLEEAHRSLAADNFEAALAICGQYLAKYPNHVLFQSLKFDVEERRRQALSRIIAETDRRVEEDPDLDRRLAILEEVMRLHPAEPHFERAIQLVRDKRDLVNSIVTKARFFEERGQFVEALDQWQILKSIHEKQPGLAFEIARIIQRRDQQALQNSKARWVDQTDKYLEGGEYDRAMNTIQHALMEFPQEAELVELKKLVQRHQERAAQAAGLLTRARENSEKGSAEQALADLREAYQLDARNSVIRTVLVNTLLEHARKSMESNPSVTDGALQEILQLDPGHVPARSLATQLADQRREEFIAGCLSQARRLQTEGDFGGALAVAAQGLASYPNEPRLQQLQATLNRVQDASQKTQDASRPPTPPVVPVPAGGPPPVQPVPSPAIPPSIKPPAPPPPSPQLRMPPPPPGWRPASPSGSGSGPTDSTASASGGMSDETVLMPTATASGEANPPVQAKTPVATPPPPPKKPAFTGLQGGLFALAAVLILLLGVALVFRKKQVPPPPPAAVTFLVSLRSTPSGAEISVNGNSCGTSNCELTLPPGEYSAEAKLVGYLPATNKFTIGAGQSGIPDVNLTLAPVPALLTITTDLTEGTVQLDGASAGEIQGGNFEFVTLPPAQHVIFVRSGPFSSKLTLDIADGATPKVAAFETNAMHGFVVAHSGTAARVYGANDGAKVSLDGKPVGAITPEGLDLKDLAPGAHEVLLESPAGSARATFDAGPATGVVAALMSRQNIGVLEISTNEDGADIYINGEKITRTTRNGKAVLNLPPKTYVVRVQKDGFVTPAEQSTDVPKAESRHLDFKLVAARAALQIHHGVAGSEVFVDGNRLGIVNAAGEFSAAYIAPGRHTVSLRQERHQSVQSEQNFAPGKTIDLDGALPSLPGTLRIEVTPADAHVRIRKPGESQDQDVHEMSLSLPEGSYTLSASAPGYQNGQTTVRVSAGASVTAPLALRRVESASSKGTPTPTTPEAAAHANFGLDDWLKLGWNRDGVTITRQGGEFVLAPPDLSKVTVQFTVILLKGKRIEWVAAYRDKNNYDIFQLDDTNFTRTPVDNGKHGKTVKVPHGAKRDGYNTLALHISPQGISHMILRDQQWKQLDDWQPVEGVSPGKFGFHIPGKDQISLSDFRITPN